MKSTLPKAVRDLTYELTRLPGIGPKTAQRLAIHLLRQPQAGVQKLADTLTNLHASVHTCSQCFNLADTEICAICKNNNRDTGLLCIVEDPLDIEAIERTESFQGVYHVLGGVLSPLEGVGPQKLTLQELFNRLTTHTIREVIIALDHNMESEATARHIRAYLQNTDVTISRIAQGLPTGGDIEFADAMTLHAAFEGRKQV
jgi:recombination protein RecR